MKFVLKSLKITLPIYRHFCKTSTVLSLYRDESTRYDKSSKFNTVKKIIIGTTVAGFLGYQLYDKQRHFVNAVSDDDEITKTVGLFKDGLPSYSLEEVSKHDSKETKVWVTYKEGIYDITDFIDSHPGGDQILLAAGSGVEPFWMLYATHENPDVYRLLESFRIGNLRKEDRGNKDTSDPYHDDPTRHAQLKPNSKKPFNAEVSPSLLIQSSFTPNELFYVRNHLPVPEVHPGTYELEIQLEGKNKTVTYTLDQLKQLPKTTITAALMCAGNRRSETAKVKPVNGLSWGPAAIGNAKWTGVRLRDLLLMAGVNEDDDYYKHVQFEGLDADATNKNYGASVPIWKAIDKRGDVLVAYEMNGAPIPRDHGYPVRVIIPGHAGARSVKWLSKITVSKNESDSHWQQRDYKAFSPSVTLDNVDYGKAPAIQEVPVTSAICVPLDGDTVKVVDGHVLIKGYAWSGAGRQIVRVDVTADGGKTWHIADIDYQDSALPPQHWAWTLWSIKIPAPKELKTMEIWAKGVDSCFNTQPESFENIYNFRGFLNNAYHRIKINLQR